MVREYDEKIDELKKIIKKISYLSQAAGLAHWDMAVNMPKDAGESRGNMLGYLSSEIYKLITSDSVKELISSLENQKGLTEFEKAMILNLRDEYNKTKKIPEDIYTEYTIEAVKSNLAWEEAKNKSDFSIFQPHLEKMVEYKRKFAEFYGYEKHPYDALLNEYEMGITVEKLDKVFGELRDAIVDILRRIENSSNEIDDSILYGNFSIDIQKDFEKYLLDLIDYDYKNRGRIDSSEHPFTTNFGNKDVRITNHYHEDNFISSMYSAIHEGGHAIYEQQIEDELENYGLQGGASMGIHESQSRFYENIIGKSKEFITYIYPEFQKRFKGFENVDSREFYKMINKVNPSLIRTESDELTYSLHVIIRYEIEKDLITGKIDVKDLPEIWNTKYEEYLGIRPAKDSEGVLQDVHWSDGSFGYFPSYALGNIYGLQFLNVMIEDIPKVYSEIEKGELTEIKAWLKANIHRYGQVYKPMDLLKKVTGEELNSKYFIEYLREKYSNIYNLQ